MKEKWEKELRLKAALKRASFCFLQEEWKVIAPTWQE